MIIEEGNLLPVNYFCGYLGERASKRELALIIILSYHNGAVETIEVYLASINGYKDCFKIGNVQLNRCKSVKELESIADKIVQSFECEAMRKVLDEMEGKKDGK